MLQDLGFILSAMFGARSPEAWAGIAAGIVYVYTKSPSPKASSRLSEAIISGLLAYAAGEWAAEWAGVHEGFATAVVASVGYLVLDVARSVVADRKVLKDIIITRLGGKSSG